MEQLAIQEQAEILVNKARCSQEIRYSSTGTGTLSTVGREKKTLYTV
jgi:hypothetical protein